jgi:hypothetical protein
VKLYRSLLFALAVVVFVVLFFASVPVYAQTAAPASTRLVPASYSSTGLDDKAAARQPAESPQPAPRTSDGKPDLSGVWVSKNEYLNHGAPSGQLPYTAAGQEAYQYNLTKEVDPQSLCILIGEPRAILDGQPFQIVQTPASVIILYERMHVWRTIPVDGRPHDKEADPSFFGDAVGSWDGDTFVVDLVDFKGEKIWTDNNAHPQSDSLHIVERWSRPDAEHLLADVTINDPKYYSQPLKIARSFKRQPYELIESSCDENNIDRAHLGNGLGTKDRERGFDPVGGKHE